MRRPQMVVGCEENRVTHGTLSGARLLGSPQPLVLLSSAQPSLLSTSQP